MMQLLMLSALFGGRGIGGGNSFATMLLNPQMWMLGKLFRKRVTTMDAIIGRSNPQIGTLLVLSKPNPRRRRRTRYYRSRRRRYY